MKNNTKKELIGLVQTARWLSHMCDEQRDALYTLSERSEKIDDSKCEDIAELAECWSRFSDEFNGLVKKILEEEN